ncbi:C13 family peptidase [bacterium]|nr:C13 family peptidase [bacterium]
MNISEKKSKPITGIAFFLVALVATTYSQTSLPIGDRFGLIIGGIGGQERYTEKYFAHTSRMYEWLVDSLGYSKITYLFSEPSFDSLRIDGLASADNVREAFDRLSGEMKAEDQLFVFLAGHGSFDGNWGKFNLVGPDLKDLDFAELLNRLPTNKIVFVNTASASGPFVKSLSGDGRVIITATKSGTQVYETTFADFFLDAITSEEADFNKDERVSMREAFVFAKTEQDRWFEDERRVRAEHPLLDDNGDGEGSQQLDEGEEDGQWSSRVYLNPVSPELQKTLQSLSSGAQTAQDSLLLKKLSLEQQIEDLKARKDQINASDYAKQLETLLIDLARTNQKLKNSKRQE